MDPIASLLYRLSIGRITPEERQILEQWAGDEPDRRALLARMADPDYVSRQLEHRTLVRTERPMADMQQRISAVRRSRVMRMLSIAAMIAVIAGISATYIIYGRSDISTSVPTEIAATTDGPSSLGEIAPGTTRAMLIAPSGETLTLSASDTAGVHDGRMILAKNCQVEAPRRLCLDVPRGGEFKIILEDSTEVWLNSESTLSYPEVFSPTERRVHVTGEAYFAVKRDEKRPFYVETDKLTVRVYGTEFNVRAYADDPYVYTTLERGSIAVTRADIPSGEVLLSPGHQAMLSREDNQLNMRTVDPQVIAGWRHGRFVFEEQPLSSIMRDLSRWYDFRYEFADDSLRSRVFMGGIPRYADFRTAIQVLENCGGIRFTLTPDNKILISGL